MVMANMAAIMNGGALISGAGYAAKFGGPAILPFFGFAAGIAIMFFGLARKLRQYGGFTLPDFMGDRLLQERNQVMRRVVLVGDHDPAGREFRPARHA